MNTVDEALMNALVDTLERLSDKVVEINGKVTTLEAQVRALGGVRLKVANLEKNLK